jgi:hypothetical protein
MPPQESRDSIMAWTSDSLETSTFCYKSVLLSREVVVGERCWDVRGSRRGEHRGRAA